MKQDIHLDVKYDENNRQTFSILGHDVTRVVSDLTQRGKGNVPESLVDPHMWQKAGCIELALRNSEIFRSTISNEREILNIDGMSSHKVRHFLNLICSSNIFNEKNYFEIGCASGSTYISSNFKSDLNSSYVCDLFLESKNGVDGREVFLENCLNILGYVPENIFNEDCFNIDLDKFNDKINMYFYDGDHSVKSHEKALTYFEKIFDDTVLVIIDDWDDWRVQLGTLVGLSKIDYDIQTWSTAPGRTGFLELNSIIIKKHGLILNDKEPFGDISRWWNGLMIMLLKKR